MADYYPLLSRAIVNLGESAGPDVRRAIYDRARTTLRSQLEGVEPPLPYDQIERERAKLEAVIARLEIEARARMKPSTLPRRYDETQEEAAEAPPAAEPEQEHGAEVAEAVAEPPQQAVDAALRAAPPGRSTPPEAQIEPHASARALLDWRKASLALVAVVALVVVGGLAVLAYSLRDQVDPVRREEADKAAADPARPQPPPDTKITSRLASDAPSPTAPDPVQQVAIAQRATLYLEIPGATEQVPRTVAGRVVWSFENLPSKPGQPLDPAFVAAVEIPDAGITLKMQMTRNRDKSLPASYLIGLIFTTKDSTVKEISPVLTKTDESERGAPLVGIQQSLGPNLFVMALSADDADIAKNFDLLSKRGWVEVQFRLADQRRGALVFEKGIAGDRALLASIDAWK